MGRGLLEFLGAQGLDMRFYGEIRGKNVGGWLEWVARNPRLRIEEPVLSEAEGWGPRFCG